MTDVLSFIGGLVLLVLGAELLVRGASKLASSFGVSSLVVGLTVVALGTSAPEVAVSVGSALSGNTAVAVGNVVGSNILNVLVILGISALIAPLGVNRQIVRQEVPVMIGASVLLLAISLDRVIGLFDSVLLISLLIGYTVFVVQQSRAASANEPREEPAKGWDSSRPVQLILILAGLGLLVFGSELFVSASIQFAKALGVSDLVIGLTIVALGTSMPELATSITAAIKGERDIAVGNVVGSNVFNILGCLGASGLASGVAGLAVPEAALSFDLWVMLAVAVACAPVFSPGLQITRRVGALFVGYYAAYVAYLVLQTEKHAALERFSSVMLGFVVPLTVVALVVSFVRPRPAKPAQ